MSSGARNYFKRPSGISGASDSTGARRRGKAAKLCQQRITCAGTSGRPFKLLVPLLLDTLSIVKSPDNVAVCSFFKMNAATAIRARMAANLVARRGFSTTRAQLASPYHYAEGPRTSIPFNPLTRFFWLRYWAFMVTGFGTPFAIAVWQTYKTR
ncbi:hypothetical protein DTO164E3_6115 [Paecilomyces variotii]|nr:hypothetical protein DTO164E3_6115 [Paecilomyces variotii]KAJ9243760.1 hypothetical protein DTO169E5_2389 [Paecilomyces variotii]KAJ9247277.1 hypothetical protein DTO195F2_9181 [Paecilomyces variotii]KAJ9374256.1 hypothetical protein DTO282E5_1178 [Paecilomyces variotii]KAJ9377974.1 hypothetical protein DTO063F5_7983 [Paecilomyces variotii]